MPNPGSIIRYWDRFYLSLQGKITVYKTLLLPQLNYIGSILMPDQITLSDISVLMENFVTQGFQIAKKRLYTAPDQGGLGLFELKDFITALQCTWIKRAFNCCNDNWKFDLVCNSDDSLHNVGKFDANNGPLLNGLSNSFRIFAEDFAKVENNYLHTPLLNCNLFGYGQRGETHFDENLFISDEIELTNNLRKLTWNNITVNGELQNCDAISAKLEAAIPLGIFNKLKVGWKIARKKISCPRCKREQPRILHTKQN